MKRIIALVTLFVFALVLAGAVYADSRTPAQKLAAGRAYLKLLDKKIIRLRKAGKTALVVKMKVDKKKTIARMKVWKAEAATGTPMAPVPPPPPVTVTPVTAPSAGLFGMGLNTGYSVGYLADATNPSIVARGDMLFADPFMLGSLVGLSDKAITWKVGLGLSYATGAKAIPLLVDGVIAIPADWMGGVDTYVSGGLNYVLYGSGRTSGSYGGQVSYGLKGDIGLGGDSYAEVGYSVIRSGAIGTSAYSLKAISVNFGTELVL